MGFLRDILDLFLLLQVIPGSPVGGAIRNAATVLKVGSDIVRSILKDNNIITSDDKLVGETFTEKVVSEGADKTNLDIELLALGDIRINVRAQNNVTLGGVVVTAAGVSETTDSGGTAILRGLPKIVVEFTVRKTGYITQRVDINLAAANARDFTLILGDDPVEEPPPETDPDFIGPINFTPEQIAEFEGLSLLQRIKNAIIFTQLAPGTILGEIVESLEGLILEPGEEIKEELLKAALVVGGSLALGGTIVGGATVVTGTAGGLGLSSLGKKVLGVATTGAGIDVLATWLASDNVITGAGFSIRNLKTAVKEGVMTKEEALTHVEKVEGWVRDAVAFVDKSVRFNPTLIVFKTPFLINNEKGLADIALEKRLLQNIGKDEAIKKLRLEKTELIAAFNEKWKLKDIQRIAEGRKQRTAEEKTERLEDEIALLQAKQEIDIKISNL